MNSIVLIHGIWASSKGSNWQDQFEEFALSKYDDIKVYKFKYGFMPALLSWSMTFGKSFQIPHFIRQMYVNAFVSFVRKVKEQQVDYKVSIIAHSFGGWITECALNKILRDNALNAVVYVHCPISSHIENGRHEKWLKSGMIQSFHSWSSYEDEVMRFAPPPFGHLGYWGFVRDGMPKDRTGPKKKPYRHLKIFNNHTNEEHSAVLDKLYKYGDRLLDQVKAVR